MHWCLVSASNGSAGGHLKHHCRFDNIIDSSDVKYYKLVINNYEATGIFV